MSDEYLRDFLRIIIYTALIALLNSSCRKLPDRFINPDLAGKFFSPSSTDPVVQAIARKIYRQQQAQPFIADLVSRAGYPLWAKAIGPSQKNLAARAYLDTRRIVYVPFSRDSSDGVDAVLIATIRGADTSLGMIYRAQYSTLPYKAAGLPGATAEALALFFMGIEQASFGHSAFVLNNSLLFRSGRPPFRKETLILNSFTLSKNTLFDFDVCWTTGGYYWGDGQLHGCPFDAPDCNPVHQDETCMSFDFSGDGEDDNYTGGSSGFPVIGGNSGEGGTGGGWNDNPCRSIAATGGPAPCNTDGTGGWQSLPNVLTDPSQGPIDSLLARYSLAINHQADSLFALSAAHHNWEYNMTIVMQDNVIYGKNIRTDMDSNGVAPDLRVNPGETLLATLHVHPRANVADRSAPSHGDIYSLSSTLLQHFIQFVECGNLRYALVIENPAKAKAYLKTHTPEILLQAIYAIAVQQPNYYYNWQAATQIAVTGTLGPVNSCGIGFYASTNSDKTIYQLLNP